MKLVFAGSGSAFTLGDNNYNSNMLLISPENNARLLIDCGSDARHSLFNLGYTYRDISDVYISHLHADHSGGLEWLALTTKFDPRCQKPNLYGNTDVIRELWQRTLSGGMSTLQGIIANLNDFFNVNSIKKNGSFIWQEISFQTVQTLHVVAGYMIVPSYGIIFTINNTRIFITTDTQFAPNQLHDFYESVDLIFHDCETSTSISGVHARYEQLAELDISIRKKMWLYHYNPGPLPDARKAGFLGFVKVKQEFQF